jgi:hypothetical protein
MRRAIRSLTVLGLGILLATAALAAPTQINGIGLVDYTQKPDFKVGDWVRYRMSGKSELGVEDDYTVTVLIAGEYDFWGDPGFWIETWKDVPGQPLDVLASMVSYEAFKDTAAVQRLQFYTRIAINTLNEDGAPRLEVNKPAASTLKTRREVKNPVRWTRDTLGVDTVSTPRGDYRALKVLLKQGTGATQSVGDSSIYQEVRENRTSYYSKDVPITHLVREDVETSAARKAWLIGRSGDGTPLVTRDRALGVARLIDMGHGGLTARLVPVEYRASIAEQRARKSGKSASPPAGRPRR